VSSILLRQKLLIDTPSAQDPIPGVNGEADA